MAGMTLASSVFPHLSFLTPMEVGNVNLVLLLLVVLLVAWLLGLGQVVHFNAALYVAGGLQTLLIVLVIVALLALVFRRVRF
ncbi:MAG TPA: hypothetical protein VF221_10300 [Chloroflexota bacterium]